MGYPSHFAGFYNAGEFAYGINKTTPALLAIAGPNTTTGAQALQLAFGYTQTNGGTVFSPLNTNAPINVGGNSSTETVTPSAVSASTPTIYSSTSLTATFAFLHGNGDQIRSGTAGLQEALNYAASKGGGIVIVDAGWASLGGTTAMIQAASVPASVTIQDNRAGGGGVQQSNDVLTNAQILALNATPVELLPAPGVGNFYNIIKATVVNESAGVAYTGGGNIDIGYGTAGTVQPIAISDALMSATAPAVTQGAGTVLANVAESTLDNQPIFVSNATAPFAAGTGTLRIALEYTVVSK